jgi:hypothetical protein
VVDNSSQKQPTTIEEQIASTPSVVIAPPPKVVIPTPQPPTIDEPIVSAPSVVSPPSPPIVSTTPPALASAMPEEPAFVSKLEDFYVKLRCNSCSVKEAQLSWVSETTGLDKIKMY